MTQAWPWPILLQGQIGSYMCLNGENFYKVINWEKLAEIKTETAYIFKIYNHAESFEQGLHKLHPAVMILSFPKDISWQTV